MREFEVGFSMFGSAYVDANSAEEAQALVSDQLIRWTGFGTDINQVQTDGVDTEVDE